MKKWNDRLVHALKAREETPADLARATGAKPPSVKDWLDGVTINIGAENALRACLFLHINVEWLILGRQPSGLEERDSLASNEEMSIDRVIQLRKHPREENGIRTRVHARVDQLSDRWLVELDKRLDEIDELIADSRPSPKKSK